jgi:tricorn protease
MKNLVRIFSLLTVLALMPLLSKANDEARMLRYPNINGNQIVFVYAGDIWTVDSNGGDARQLTSHKGLELFPKISPDGKWIAFSAEYSGSRQVYIIPSQGGTPQQLTYYNSIGEMPPRGGFDNVILGWTPDSKKVLFRANRTQYGDRMGNYYTVSIEGGLEEELPVPHGGFADLSPDGKKLVFSYIDREFRTWKRYKGGRASKLWIYDLEKNVSEQITEFKGTDHIPTWYGDKIYFASDRDLWLNIHSYNVKTKEIKQITKHQNFDVMWPSGTNGQIAYEVGGYLYKLNLETEKSERVPINIKYDFANTLPYHKNVKDNIHSSSISPSGNRVLFDARGDIFSVPAGEGTTHNLTDTQGVRSVYPQWSPDGKWIAYYSDQTGEYEVYLLENKENAIPKQITKNSKGWKYPASWSPNSKLLVFFDRSMRLQLLDVESGKLTVIDTPTSDEIRNYDFSPDSRWVTYTKNSLNGLSAIWVFNVETGKTQQLTNDTFGDRNPVFSKCGNYIFFLSNRDFNLTFSDFEFNYLYNRATRIYALALRNDSPRLFEPKETIETVGKDDKKEVNNATNVAIDFNGANNRIMAFPFASGAYWNLQPVSDGLVYFSDAGMQRYIIKEQKNDVIMTGVRNATLSADGKKFLYQSRGEYGVASLAPNQKVGDGKLNLDNLTMRIEPRKEWEQIFVDGWRIYRDYFYVANLHNVDWNGFRKKYGEMLPNLNHRIDLDYIFGEMIAETNTGHAYANYGDFERVQRVETGLLGAKLTADVKNKRYIISKIFQGENWDPTRRSPLTEVGISINEGDYIIQIDGKDVTTNENPYKFLENKVDKAVRLTVNSKPTLQGARTFTVRPINSELELMYLDWVNSRRALVDKLSGGRIGYIHVPNTAVDGNRELNRGMYAYHHKDALIIDERFNGGGFIPDRMVELLSRQTHAHWHRAGLPHPMRTPGVAHDGPKAMLINQYSSSGGDAFPYFFRQKNLGTIIGSRTWGGLIGISGNAVFMDGGSLSVPRFGIYNDKGEWIIEGIGVYPDIEVIDTPHLLSKGQDPSLEKAVEVLLKQLEQNPPKKWTVPADPDRSGWIEVEIK